MSSDDSGGVSFHELGGDRIDRRTAMQLFSAAGLSGLAGCMGGGDVTPEDSSGGDSNTEDGSSGGGNGGTLKIGELQGNVKTLDPQQCSTGVCYRIIQYIHSGLVDVNSNFEIVPGLATDWDTPDDTTVIFNLRENAKWQNGDDFTADDWVYTLDRVRSDDFNALYEGELAPIEEAVAEDDYTLRLNLSEPYAPLFAYLTPVGRAGIPINKNVVEEYGNDEYGNHPVGCGPFQLDEWTSRQNLKLSTFDDYWGESPSIDGIQVDLIEDQNALANALLSGSIHIAPSVPTAQVKALEGSDGLTLHQQLTGNYHYISINCDREPFDDVKVRQALMLGIDREAAVESVFQGLAETNGYPLSPAFEGAYPDEESFQQYDPERAKELLAEAGYPDGFETEFLTPNLEPWRSAGEWLAQELEEINVDAELRVMEWAAFREKTASEPFEYDIFNLQWIGDIDPDQEVSMFHKESGLNRTNYMDDQATELVEEQRRTLGTESRNEVLKELVSYVAENGPYAVFASQKRTYAVSEKVEGFEPHPAMYILAEKISLQ